MRIEYFPGILAGFHGNQPDPAVPELDRAGEEWLPRNYHIPPHSHSDWELYLQLEGVSFWECRDRCCIVPPGCLFLPPPRAEHAMVGHSRSSHHFVFAGVDINQVLKRMPEIGPLWIGGDVLVFPDATHIIDPFRLLIREISLDQPYRSLGIRAAMDSLIIEASRLMGGVGQPGRFVPSHKSVDLAKKLMEGRPGLPWRQQDLADACGLSASRLQQLFTQIAGVSPRQYLLRTRIDRARSMLAATDASITNIALELGFSSSQHFAIAFRRLTGESPTTYRDRTNASTAQVRSETP